MSLQTKKTKPNQTKHQNKSNQINMKVQKRLHAGWAPVTDKSSQIPNHDHCSQHLERLLAADTLVHS